MNTLTANMGPANAGNTFTIPSNSWTVINERVYQVLNHFASGPFQQSGQIPAYNNLFAACTSWNATTFPGLVQLAKEIVTYGGSTVPTQYKNLQNIINGIQNNQMTPAEAQSFNTILQLLNGFISTIQNSATNLSQQIQQFAKINVEIDSEYAHNGALTTIAPSPTLVANAAETVEGGWSSICSDLVNLQTDLSHLVSSDLPFLLNLNLQAAITDWAGVVSETNNFLTDASAQEQVLLGNFGYDDPFISQGQAYRLYNIFLGNTRYLDTYSNESNQPFMNDNANSSGSYWIFTRVGGGWYHLTNQFLGINRFLDTYNNDGNLPFMGNTPGASGSFWKLTPSGNGTYRFSNSYLGDKRFLDTYSNDGNLPFMNDGTLTSGSQWMLV